MQQTWMNHKNIMLKAKESRYKREYILYDSSGEEAKLKDSN